MVFREVTMIEIKEILRRWLRDEPKSEIARQCGVSRGTVRTYIGVAEDSGLAQGQPESALTDDIFARLVARLHPEGGRPHGDGWQRCEEQREFIQKHIKDGVRLTKIRKLLKRQRDTQVSYATLRRFATEQLGFGMGASTMPVVDGKPGKEVQLDTGWVGRIGPDLCGRFQRFRAWIFTPVVSRYRFVYPVFKETTETAIEACEAAWEFYGGMFEVLIPDNTKVIVYKADPLQPQFNTTFLEYCQARGLFIDPTRVRSPKDKGRVERSVRLVRDDCFAGEHLLDLEDTRRHALHWCREENGMQRHGSTLRLPREHFEAEERAQLLAPPSEPYDVPLWCEPKVHRDQHAQVAKALYSLPAQFKGRTLKARADRTSVRFYDGTKLVKMHARLAAGQRWQTDRNDFPPEKAAYAMRDVQFLVRRASEYGEAVGRFASALLDSPLPWTRMRQVYALLGFGKRYGAARLEAACTTALEVEMIDIYRLRRLLEIAATRPSSVAAPAKVLPIARHLRPPQQFALPLSSSNQDPTKDTKGNDHK